MRGMADNTLPVTASAPPVPDALEVIRTRSVVRDYTAEPVDDAAVDTLLEALLAAPSASNKQAWAFVVVRQRARVRRLRAFAPGVIGTPTLMLVACVDQSRVGGDPNLAGAARMCVAMAVQNFLLAAHALGLGACPVHSFLPDPIRLLLGIPGHLKPVLVVPTGYPARDAQPSDRRDKDEVIRYETYR
jgi:albonoursin synthase